MIVRGYLPLADVYARNTIPWVPLPSWAMPLLTVILPLAQSVPAVAAPQPRVPAHSLDGRLLAVIDDEPGVREAMRALLAEWGIVTVTGADAAEVLTGVSSHIFVVVFGIAITVAALGAAVRWKISIPWLVLAGAVIGLIRDF